MSKPELALVIVAASLVGVVILIGLYRFVTVNPDLRNDDIELCRVRPELVGHYCRYLVLVVLVVVVIYFIKKSPVTSGSSIFSSVRLLKHG